MYSSMAKTTIFQHSILELEWFSPEVFFSMNQWCSGESSFVGLLHLWWHHWKTPRKGFFSDIQYIFKDFSFRFTEILFLPTVGVLKYWISTAIGPAMWNRPYWRPIFCTQTSTVWSNMWRFKNMVSSRPKNWENTIEGSIGNPRKSKHNLNPNIPLSLNWSPISMDPFPPVPPTQPVWTTVVVVRMTFLVRTLLTAAEWCARFLDSSWNTSGGWIWIWIDMDGDCLVKESLKQKKRWEKTCFCGIGNVPAEAVNFCLEGRKHDTCFFNQLCLQREQNKFHQRNSINQDYTSGQFFLENHHVRWEYLEPETRSLKWMARLIQLFCQVKLWNHPI